MNYALLATSILCLGLSNTALHFFSNGKLKTNPYLFNLLTMVIWVVVLLTFNLGFHSFTKWTFIWGCVYGFVLSLMLLTKTLCYAKGPIATTSLVSCSSFVVTTIFNVIYFKETVGALEIIGIILMLAACIFMNLKKGDGKTKTSWYYIILLIIYFFTSAFVGIIFRFHQSVDSVSTNEMMITASGSAIIFFTIFYLIFGRKSGTIKQENNKNAWIFVAILFAAGIFSCTYGRINIYLSGALPSYIFFPIYNGGGLMLTTTIGLVFFKEKLNIFKIVGLLMGFISILLMSHIFGLV